MSDYIGTLTYVDADGEVNRLYPSIQTDTTTTLTGQAADAAVMNQHLCALYAGGATGTTEYVITDWEQGNINAGGTNTDSTSLYRTGGYHPVIPDVVYTVDLTDGNGLNTRAYDENKTFLRSYNLAATTGSTTGTIAFGEDVAWFRSVVVAYDNDVTTYPVAPEHVRISLPSGVGERLDATAALLEERLDTMGDQMLMTNQTTVKSGNMEEILPNGLLTDAPANSVLVIAPSATPLIGDLPSVEADTLWLLTCGNTGNQAQILLARKDTVATGLCYRTVYNYGGDSPNASLWQLPGEPWRGADWCFFGDSLTYRASSGYGYPDVLGIHGTVVNRGTQQATLAAGSCSIQDQVDAQIAEEGEFDGIILEGGYNDWYGSPLGEVPATLPDSVEELDRTTTCGGLTYCLYQLMSRYPTARLYYLAVHRINSAPFAGNGSSTVTQEEITQAAIAICQLFGVEVIDCYHQSGLNTYYDGARALTQDADGIHPTREAFQRFYRPVIVRHVGAVAGLVRE